MRRPRRDVFAVALASGALAFVLVGNPAHADTTAPQPTSPPTEGSPTDSGQYDRRDPREAYDAALRDAQTVAVAEAQQLMQEALTELDTAELNLKTARAEAESAREAEEEARKELKISERVIERTERQIDEIKERTDGTRAAVGTVVREAYQNNGLATLGVLLGAESPEDLDNRYVGMQTVLRAGDAALGQLAGDQADLRNALATLDGQRKQQEELADRATRQREAAESAEARAKRAQASRVSRQEELEHALALAEDARLEDYERYMEQIDESTAIGEYLNGLSEEDFGPTYGTGAFVRPGTGPVTSEYGSRLHPILGYVKMHTGIDFGRGDGKIYAADSGTVIEARFNTAYGYMVIVDHGDFEGRRLTTLYAHQSGLSVQVGQRVEKGQVIGNIGSTGYSTGPHLHFEVLLGGQHTNPRAFLP